MLQLQFTTTIREEIIIYPAWFLWEFGSQLMIMQEITKLGLDELVDLLARYSAEYSRMSKEGYKEAEYKECRQMIQVLQDEIEYRRAKKMKRDPGAAEEQIAI